MLQLSSYFALPHKQQRVRPKGPQFPVLLPCQGEGETGVLRSMEEKVFSRDCQTVMPNYQHLKYSSAFQIVHFKCTTCSLLSSQLTLYLFPSSLSKPWASSLSFHSISANDRYNSNNRELVFLFVLLDKTKSWKESPVILNIEIWTVSSWLLLFVLYKSLAKAFSAAINTEVFSCHLVILLLFPSELILINRDCSLQGAEWHAPCKAVMESKFPLTVEQNETVAELEIIFLQLNSCDVLD